MAAWRGSPSSSPHGRWVLRAPNVICPELLLLLFGFNPSTMASNIPASLRTADIGRFALRAAQIEKAKPVVAYWCESSVNAPPPLSDT